MVDILDIITTWVSSYGYLGIFLAALAETIFPPIPSVIVFPLAGFVAFQSEFSYFETFLLATSGASGATVGAIVVYFLSYKLGRMIVIKIGKYIFISERKIELAERWFEKYGVYAVFFGRMIPAVRELISVPAGIARMPIVKFITFTFFGSLVWGLFLVYAGYFFGNSWETLSEKYEEFSPIFTIAAVSCMLLGGIIAYIIVKRRKGGRISK
jgi:membrane protein DedA with SNARE-associated domain